MNQISKLTSFDPYGNQGSSSGRMNERAWSLLSPSSSDWSSSEPAAMYANYRLFMPFEVLGTHMHHHKLRPHSFGLHLRRQEATRLHLHAYELH